MSIFNLTDEKMKETSSTFTAHEIYQQPATWRKTCAQLAACKDELQAFIDQVVKQDDFDIVLVGAGTSEFVGNSLFQALNPKYNYKVKSYASTDIVPSPENFLSRTKPTLLVNFGRSGNSPESLGNVEAYDKQVEVWGFDNISVEESKLGLNGSPTRVFKSFTKGAKSAGKVFELEPAEAADLIVEKLQEKFII